VKKTEAEPGHMVVLDTVKKRRSIRDFEERHIPEGVLENLVEALRWAPSAGNLQSRKFFFVQNTAARKKLAAAVGNPDLLSRVRKAVKKVLKRSFVSRAPLVVVACADRRISQKYGDRGVDLYSIQDAAASVMNMMLVAHDLGLGSVWVGGFDESKVVEILQLPENLRPVALVPVGYPAEAPLPSARKEWEEIVEFIL
ncbi:MAG: nitroreductase family protein, partial [Thermodesulfobacteriota bacterium]